MRNPFRSSGRYAGPRVWIPFDHAGPDGKQLVGGWHYSTRIWRGQETPDRRLHLNDDAPDESAWFYEFAQPGHKSWVEKHGEGNLVALGGVSDGIG